MLELLSPETLTLPQGLSSQETRHLLILALMFTGYSLVHSLLAARSLKAAVDRHWPVLAPWYRMTYNFLAVILLVPVLAWLYQWPGGDLWVRPWPLAWLFDALALAALAAFVHSLRHYDLSRFSGSQQLRTGAAHADTDAGEALRLGFWHRFVRHPWYCFALVILWTRDLNPAELVFCLVASLYLLLGSRLEERKLVARFGAAYLDYRRRVPGLLPWPGRWLSQAEAERLETRAINPAG